MNIAATQFSLTHNALEIYLSGCDGKCGCDCHNRELWSYDVGSYYINVLEQVREKIGEFSNIIKQVWVLGGEPLLQKEGLLEDMLNTIRGWGIPVMLFTRYKIEEVPDYVKKSCYSIKCGEFDPNLLCDDNISYGIKLMTSNQRVYNAGIDY